MTCHMTFFIFIIMYTGLTVHNRKCLFKNYSLSIGDKGAKALTEAIMPHPA